MGLFDRIYRAVAGSVLQLSDRAAVGVDIDRQRAGKRGPDGHNVARPAPPRWLSLAMDAELGGADRYQYVALSIVSAVSDHSIE